MFLFLPFIRDNSDPSSQYLVKPRNPRVQKPETPCDQNLVKHLCSIVKPPRLKWYWVKRKLVNRQVVAKCLMKTSSLKMSERYHVTPRRPYWCKKTAAMFKENRLHWEFTRISYSVVRFIIILFLLPQFLLRTKVIFTLRLAFLVMGIFDFHWVALPSKMMASVSFQWISMKECLWIRSTGFLVYLVYFPSIYRLDWNTGNDYTTRH